MAMVAANRGDAVVAGDIEETGAHVTSDDMCCSAFVCWLVMEVCCFAEGAAMVACGFDMACATGSRRYLVCVEEAADCNACGAGMSKAAAIAVGMAAELG